MKIGIRFSSSTADLGTHCPISWRYCFNRERIFLRMNVALLSQHNSERHNLLALKYEKIMAGMDDIYSFFLNYILVFSFWHQEAVFFRKEFIGFSLAESVMLNSISSLVISFCRLLLNIFVHLPKS